MDKIIETARLLLRPVERSDGPELASKINNYEISKNLARVPFPYTLADAEDFFDWTAGLDHRSAFRVISLKTSPTEFVGMISYDWMENQQTADMGYWLVPEQWGQGIMSEAAKAMVELAFIASDLNKLGSCFFNDNPASGKVLARAGFTVTGTCSQYSKARDAEVLVTKVRLLREDWRHKKAAR